MFSLFDPVSWESAIRAAEPMSFWFWTIVLCTAAIAALFGGFVFLVRAWTVEETPLSLIRSAAQGYVKLEGHADLMPGPPIISPLTSCRCVWWSYKIEERVSSGRSSHWETVDHGTCDDLFLIRDSSGQCVVDPDNAEVIPATETVWYGDEPQPLTGPSIGSFALASKYRYVEKLINPQEFIFALGFFHTQGGNTGATAINDEVAQLLHEWKQSQADLLRRFDTNHDGQIDQQEWETAREAAREQILLQEQQAAQRPPVDVLSQPKDGRRFMISTRQEARVVRRFQLWAAACLLLFVIGGGVAGFIITTRLSVTAAVQPTVNLTP
ncbi:MAG TPA: GIDE domain-containing protein [Gammaproteobacteria bacterium]|nr:GIDE domain-containing protein [Gammaproteobacteria bacterium]